MKKRDDIADRSSQKFYTARRWREGFVWRASFARFTTLLASPGRVIHNDRLWLKPFPPQSEVQKLRSKIQRKSDGLWPD
jgi:hypothetical protein